MVNVAHKKSEIIEFPVIIVRGGHHAKCLG